MKTLLAQKIKKLVKENGYVSTSMFTDLERRYIENMPENANVRKLKRSMECGK